MSMTVLEDAWHEHLAADIPVRQALAFEIGATNPIPWMVAQRRAERAGPGEVAAIEPLERLAAPMRTSRVSDLLAGLFSQVGEVDRSFIHAADAIRFVPEWDPLAVAHVANTVAVLLFRAGHHDEAVRWAERGLAYDPCYSNLLGTLCQCLASTDATRAASVQSYLAAVGAPPEMWKDVPIVPGTAPHAPSLAGLPPRSELDLFRLMAAQRYDHNRHDHVKATALALALAAHGRWPEAELAARVALEQGAARAHLARLRELIERAVPAEIRAEASSDRGAFATRDEVRLQAIVALEQAGDASALRGLFFDVSFRVSMAACQALFDLGEASWLVPYLELAADVVRASRGTYPGPDPSEMLAAAL